MLWDAERDPVNCCALFMFHVISDRFIWQTQQGWENPDPDTDPVQIQIQTQIQIQITAYALYL